MKVTQLCYNDRLGGAAVAAYRIHRGVLSQSVNSSLVVARKHRSDPSVRKVKTETRFQSLLRRIESLPLRMYRHRSKNSGWSINWLVSPSAQYIQEQSPDIIHLHWLGQGFLSIRSIGAIQQPIVWTLHDSGVFTGGCHLPFDCERFVGQCGCCPQLKSSREGDLSRWIWQLKQRSWGHANMAIVTPSTWLAGRARISSLFSDRPVHVIPNGLDVDLYKPVDKRLARQVFGLPDDRFMILFGAVNSTSDWNKGYDLLRTALQELAQTDKPERYIAVVLGADAPSQSPAFGIETHYLGTLQDEYSLVLAYSAADALVMPSRQENLPNMIMEAMACGTPAIGFRVGGIPDLIEHKVNGYLAVPNDTSDLAVGIRWLADSGDYDGISQAARAKIKANCAIEHVAKQYISLYESLLADSQ